MPGKHTELYFEDAIVDHLTSHGWLQGESAQYDRTLALYPDDVIGWIQGTQPQEWQKLAAYNNGSTEKRILERLAKCIEKDGALAVLRHGFKDVAAHFEMCQFAATHTLNPLIQEHYSKIRLRVVRQLQYSSNNTNEIDLVLFVNGIPVATCELKSDFTQSVEHAIHQYRTDRLPRDPKTHKDEPLIKRTLVHFAVSQTEVAMCTKLIGKESVFLPFNMGNNDAAGNPPNPDGYATSYLWERIFDCNSFLEIVGRFLHIEKQQSQEKTIFPRFHQWDCVTKLVHAVREERAGHRYLIQHSAGSGKTNTIAWLAHHLSDLYDAENKKIFDSIIVITDRNVLDAQLQEAIYQFEHKSGVVQKITSEHGAKSEQLAQALSRNTLIIIVTIQTFPFVMEHIGASDELKQRTYAIIADEAHSSQTGGIARKVRQMLSNANTNEAEEGEEIDSEDILAAQVQGSLFPNNMSYFAFTATPKAKTIELFGTLPDPARQAASDNIPAPFHCYSMQQAIEEGYILDVLKNYTSYKMAYKLAYNGQEYDENTVDETKALKSLIRWVKLHPYNISQKVAIIVEHFRSIVQWRLDGHAKAMVVTGSRKEAVRYTIAIKKYIHEHRYDDIGVLVAFSGDVADSEEFGADVFNERTMNLAIYGQDLREAFKQDHYRIMLVANKFQTGFDQPLLCAMYVDKRLAGITAVQTLSRLNRTYPGKEATFILDFANDPNEILAAFQVYYRDARLSDVTNPNIIIDLQSKLDDLQLYSTEEVDALARMYVHPEHTQKELVAVITPIAARIKEKEKNAREGNDAATIEILKLFRKDMQSFIRMYEFLSQIVDYGSTDLEKHTIFYRCLLPYLSIYAEMEVIDLSKVVMTHYHLHRNDTQDMPLAGGEGWLNPPGAIGTGEMREPKSAYLADIIKQLNAVFEGDVTEADIVNYANLIRDKMLESETVRSQAEANSPERLVMSPDFDREMQRTIIAALRHQGSMSEQLLSNDEKMAEFRNIIAALIYQSLQNSD